MRDGIHIPAVVVRVGVLVMAAVLAYLIKDQLPEAARYLKIERM
jgi:hypothetical protein